MSSVTKTPDHGWSVVDPMGHEHRWVKDTLPTLDADNRCLRCGHAVEPRYRTESPSRSFLPPALRGPKPVIVSVSIEARPDSVEVVTNHGMMERIPGRVRYFMKVTASSGAFPDEFEISEKEARIASEAYRKGELDVYAADLLKRHGFSIT